MSEVIHEEGDPAPATDHKVRNTFVVCGKCRPPLQRQPEHSESPRFRWQLALHFQRYLPPEPNNNTAGVQPSTATRQPRSKEQEERNAETHRIAPQELRRSPIGVTRMDSTHSVVRLGRERTSLSLSRQAASRFDAPLGLGDAEHFFDRWSHQHDDRKHPEHRTYGHEHALDSRDDQTEHIAAILVQSSPGNRDAHCHREPTEYEGSGQKDKYPTEECRRRRTLFNIIERTSYDRDSHREVNDWEHRDQRKHSRHDVVKDGEKPKVLGVFVWFHVSAFLSPTTEQCERSILPSTRADNTERE